MAKKTKDPRLMKLLDAQEVALQSCERWYARLKRAFNGLEKGRRQMRSLARRIQKLREELETPATAN